MGKMKELAMLLSEYDDEEIAALKMQRDAALAASELCPLTERELLALLAHEIADDGEDERTWVLDVDDG